MDGKKYILYGVLNWGLGHATRSVPVIKALVEEGFTPVIASDGMALTYLSREFPLLPSEQLPSYRISYGQSFLAAMFFRAPFIWTSILQEHRALKVLVEKYHPAGIISDNRLGFYHREVPSVYITHQLKIILPFPASLANAVHHYYINKYRECWVPDFRENGLAGSLSHHSKPRIKTKFTGPLSRFEESSGKPEEQYHAAAVLSGPEPQRTLLEEKVVHQLSTMEGKFLLIRGTDKKRTCSVAPGKIEVRDLADTEEVRRAVQSSAVVISRSGYSSIMDYYYLKNKALLIPTPGQAEQEYLADYLKKEGFFHAVSQKHLDLNKDIPAAKGYKGFSGSGAEQADRKSLFGLFEGK